MATNTSTAGTTYCSSCGSNINAEAELCPECGVRQGGSTRKSTSSSSPSEPMSRVMSAVIGGVVGFFLGWLPILGPIAGGATAGFLRGENVKESAITGTLANVLASIPTALLAAIFLLLGGIGAASSGSGDAAFGLVVWVGIFLVSFAYFYLLGALGGVIGAKVSDRGDPLED